MGISASDAACFLAEPMQLDEREGGLGFVGYLTGVNLDFLRSLWRASLVPVACCLGLGADGEIYNINADHMAAAAAEFVQADRLIFLTDVEGVLDGAKVLRVIGGGEIEELIRHNKVSGGMILKLEAAKRALAAGISEVRIVGGTLPKALASAIERINFPRHAGAARSSFLRRRDPRSRADTMKKSISNSAPEICRRANPRGRSALPYQYLSPPAHRFHAGARLPALRFRRPRVSGFSGRHRGERARPRAS